MSLVQSWRDRPERERRAIAIGAAALGAILVIGLVWVPLERARTRLSAELPALRASIAILRGQNGNFRKLLALSRLALWIFLLALKC